MPLTPPDKIIYYRFVGYDGQPFGLVRQVGAGFRSVNVPAGRWVIDPEAYRRMMLEPDHDYIEISPAEAATVAAEYGVSLT